MNRVKLSIEAALPSMPSDVCGLVAEYGWKRPHIWQADGIDSSYRLESESTKIKTNGWIAYGYLRWSKSGRYQKIVSAATMADGDCNWSICIESVDADVMIGVTTGSANYVGDDSTIFFEDGRLMQFYDHIHFYKNGCSYVKHQRTTTSASATVHFAADRKTLRITAMSDGIANGQPLVFMDDMTDDEFLSMRPCVLLAGPATATIASL
jgi:hypothetical protein